MSKLDDMNLWRVFLSLCGTRNFSYTAAELDVEVSTVSRNLSQLEKTVGQSLFQRTRPLKLTREGEKILSIIEPVIHQHTDAIDRILKNNSLLEGGIRLSVSHGVATRHLRPFLEDFNKLYPNVSFTIAGSGSINDVTSYKADIACVSGMHEGKDLMLLPRGRNIYVPVATPSYIKKFGMPTDPSDLTNFKALQFDGATRSRFKTMRSADRTVEIDQKHVMVIGSILGIKDFVLEDYGFCLDMPLFLCIDELLEKKLIPVLPGWACEPAPTYVACTQSAWRNKLNRVFIKYLQESFLAFFEAIETKAAPVWKLPFDDSPSNLRKDLSE